MKRQRKYSFIVVSFLIFKISGYAQELKSQNPVSEIEIQFLMHKLGKSFPVSAYPGKYGQHPETSNSKKSLKNFSSGCFPGVKATIFKLSPYRTEAFFCRQEIMIEKRFSLPVRLRLGSLSYVDYLERKPNAFNPLR